MQWIQLCLWGLGTVWAAKKPLRAKCWAFVLCAGLLVSMGTQLWLLGEVGQFNLGTAVPLHLCSLMGILSIPMLLFRSSFLYSFSMLLGMPGALLALFFPAIANSARPTLMALSFYRLHVLIVCAPLLLLLQGFPLRLHPKSILLFINAYMALVSLFNALFRTNYLFLRFAPIGTPLEWLAKMGSWGYVLSLEMIAILTITFLSLLYERLPLPLYTKQRTNPL